MNQELPNPVHAEIVEQQFVDETHRIPLIIEPGTDDAGLVTWSSSNSKAIESKFKEHGALLFRGFDLDAAEDLARLSMMSGGTPLPYVQRSTKRSKEAAGVYTSTEYPSEKSIGLHSENAFQWQWPRRIIFWAVSLADIGGATPIADNTSVCEAIDISIVQEFVRRGVRYLRNFGGGLELPWQEAFQTENKTDVEKYCVTNNIQFEWLTNDRLRTEQNLPAVIYRPGDRRMVWFNQAHLFHLTNLEAGLREALLDAMPEKELPRHCYFADGDTIPDKYFDNIRAAYDRCTVRFPWKRNDVMLLDNLRICHGRDPYVGQRKVLVSMSELTDFSRFS